MGQEDHQRELRQFGRLETLVGDIEPASGTTGLDADAAGNQHQNEQGNGKQEQGKRNLLEVPVIDTSDAARRQ